MDTALLVCAVVVGMHGAGMNPIERAGYIAHAYSKAFRTRLDEATRLICEHPRHVVSTSWGKDSMVLLHLAAGLIDGLSVINARYPNPAERFGDMDRVRDAMLSRADMARVRYTEVHTPGEWKEAARWWKENFTRNMGAAMTDAGGDGVFLGLRAEESYARRMNLATHGTAYERADGLHVVLPLSRWSGRDVWAYMSLHDLPRMRIYDECSCSRERARSGFVFATGGAGAIRRHGVWDDWKRIYRSEFTAWVTRFPELDK